MNLSSSNWWGLNFHSARWAAILILEHLDLLQKVVLFFQHQAKGPQNHLHLLQTRTWRWKLVAAFPQYDLAKGWLDLKVPSLCRGQVKTLTRMVFRTFCAGTNVYLLMSKPSFFFFFLMVMSKPSYNVRCLFVLLELPIGSLLRMHSKFYHFW